MKRKKIFILIPSLSVGGAERVLVNLLKKIDVSRFDITLCLLAKCGVYFDEIPSEIRLKYVLKLNFMARCFTYLKLHIGINFPIRWCMKLTVKECYDVGISFSDGTLTDNILFVANKFKKKIAWVHSCYITQQLFTPARVRELKYTRYNKLDHIVFVSKKSELEFRELFGTAVEHSVIYNLFDNEAIKQKCKQSLDVKINGDVVNIIAVGRMVAVKQYDKLIEAAHILAKRGVKFKMRLVGDGELREELQTQVKKMDLEKYVDFIGFKSNPYPYIKHSDILVISSQSEAFPTVMIEAMSLETAVVATKCTGCIEISDEGKYALLTEKNAESIADGLEKIAIDDTLRHSLIECSKRRVFDYDEQTSLNKIYQLWEV